MTEESNIKGIKCLKCSTLTYPKRTFCPKCRETELEEWNVPSEAFLYTYTIVKFPLSNYDNESYIIGLAIFDTEHPKVTVRIDLQYINDLEINKKLKLSEKLFLESKDLPIISAKPF